MGIITIEKNSASNPAVVAEKVDLEFENPVPPKHLNETLDDFLLSLTALLQNNGCLLIGHIKGMLNNEKNEHIFFSITGFGEEVRYKGQLSGLSKRAKLVMNVIVYGIDEDTLQSGIRDALEKYFRSDGNK